jgi:hypothetical protein
MAAKYSEQNVTVCTNINDPSCKNSQEQNNEAIALQAKLNADSKYDPDPSPPAVPGKTIVITQGFTTLQSTSMGLFVVATLFIVYGLVSRVSKRRK